MGEWGRFFWISFVLEQIQFPGSHQGLRTAVGIELAIDVADVGLDRARGDEELLGDPAV